MLEVNGAVDFGEVYAPGEDVFANAMHALARRLFMREPTPLTAVA